MNIVLPYWAALTLNRFLIFQGNYFSMAVIFKKNMKKQNAFTLVELILVIAIIAVLAGAIFVAIDPARRLHEARNARRSSDIATILDALKKYQVDNGGAHYTTVNALTAGEYSQIGTDATGCNQSCDGETTQTACVNLSAIGDNYLSNIPLDPNGGTAAQTDYALSRTTNGALTLVACGSEGEGAGGAGTPPSIRITR